MKTSTTTETTTIANTNTHAQPLIVALMPGSRRSEIRHHLEVQIRAAEIVALSRPDVRFVLPLAPSLKPESVDEILKLAKVPITVLRGEPTEMIATADVVLCASGTATLLVALLQKPMVVMYRMNAFSARMAKWLVKSIPFFTMVNLILKRAAVPEFFQNEASPSRLAEEILKLVSHHPEDLKVQDAMKNDFVELRLALGDRGATARVAEALSPYLKI